jgi:hypothetical protein
VAQKEIIENGVFASDTIWTKGDAAITIAAGVCTFSGAQAGAVQLYQARADLRGKKLVITFTITRNAGGVTLKCGTAAGTQRVLTGTYTEVLYMLGGDNIAFEGDATFDGTIDNVTGYIDTDETAPEISGGDTSEESSPGTTREYTLPTDAN